MVNQEVELWLHNPMTKQFLSMIASCKEAAVVSLAQGITLNSPERALIDTAILVGRIQALDITINNTIIEMKQIKI